MLQAFSRPFFMCNRVSVFFLFFTVVLCPSALWCQVSSHEIITHFDSAGHVTVVEKISYDSNGFIIDEESLLYSNGRPKPYLRKEYSSSVDNGIKDSICMKYYYIEENWKPDEMTSYRINALTGQLLSINRKNIDSTQEVFPYEYITEYKYDARGKLKKHKTYMVRVRGAKPDLEDKGEYKYKNNVRIRKIRHYETESGNGRGRLLPRITLSEVMTDYYDNHGKLIKCTSAEKKRLNKHLRQIDEIEYDKHGNEKLHTTVSLTESGEIEHTHKFKNEYSYSDQDRISKTEHYESYYDGDILPDDSVSFKLKMIEEHKYYLTE